jgi:hypothetical protein
MSNIIIDKNICLYNKCKELDKKLQEAKLDQYLDQPLDDQEPSRRLASS